MSDEYARAMHARRRRYAREAVVNQVRDAHPFRQVYWRVPPRLRLRVGQILRALSSPFLFPLVAGLAAAGVFAALRWLDATPVGVGVGVAASIWGMMILSIASSRFRRRASAPPGRGRGGPGPAGVREPRRPRPDPGAMSVELTEPRDGVL